MKNLKMYPTMYSPKEMKTLMIAENFLANENNTVRSVGEKMKLGKSTVHIHLKEKIDYINPQLANKVKLQLEKNKVERTIRGGEATKQKYLKK